MLLYLLYKLDDVIKRIYNKIIISPGIRSGLKKCGKKVKIGLNPDFKKLKNISIGNNVDIGPNARIWSTLAEVKIGNNVIFGPNVSIISGDHDIYIIGKKIRDVDEKMKNLKCDQDVIIEDDVWIGTNVTILKGVTIGTGAVIAAGSVVNKSVDSYSIYAGVPAKKIKNRFDDNDLIDHIKIINEQEKNKTI